ncbi:VWA domain-containing protein [Pseudenhygromyxa sp. WMMC2535]|uniref:VWA domain-containing protein n=1 Tax=Pseudenhygromyxa sp. WMMC2535 TaxID=2712867 RepID=UPI0015961A2B|nr:VWA domain-containing protein [Pseudenhygromyxa sp. WMMC2535]NVB36302.1 VWA domain-containing protein [Pseudenhygromyxa sp. WMMC2535]
MSARGRLPLFALCALTGLATFAAPAAADTLDGDPQLGYVPVEELSYEAIIRPGKDYEAELALRVALRNASTVEQDAVETLVLPRGSELVALAINAGGDWREAEDSSLVGGDVEVGGVEQGRRDPGSIWVRPLESDDPGDLPAVELVAFGLAPRATVQVELRLRVYPTLRGDRWQLELPRRNAEVPNLVDQRRVLVQGLGEGESFWVDDTSSAGTPYMVTRSEDAVAVSWPARAAKLAQLDGSFETSPDKDGRGGRVRLVLRLGPSKAISPDHVVLVVDGSLSGASSLAKDSGRVFAQLLDQLPESTTFDALAFDREARALLEPSRVEGGAAPRVDDAQARSALGAALTALRPGQGTDLRAAMRLVGEHLSERKAKRPLVLVVTDGMLPPSVDADVVDAGLRDALGGAARPELLFVIDDPLLNARGLPAEHPVAQLAAGLGARISLETVANLGPAQTGELLAAPRVLGELDLGLPKQVVLDDALPTGLVAGDFVVLEGRYEGKAPTRVKVRGRLGRSKISASFRALRRAGEPHALVATSREGDAERAREEGLVLPDWYTPSMRRLATQNLAQAGRVGWQAVGQLDGDIILRQLRSRVLPRARACYNKALTRNQVLAGQVELAMEVGKGEVMMAGVAEAELNYGDDALVTCLEEAAWALDVPAGHLDTQVYQVRYPLDFEPPEGGRPPSTGERSDPMLERLLDSAEVLADYQNHLDE